MTNLMWSNVRCYYHESQVEIFYSYNKRSDIPDQCNKIIEVGEVYLNNKLKWGVRRGEINPNTRLSNISFIPFESLVPMYRELEKSNVKVQ